MLIAMALAAVLAASSQADPFDAPADGLRLAPRQPAESRVSLPVSPPTQPRSPSVPLLPSGLAAIGLAAVGAFVANRPRDDEPLFVVVHGDGGSADDFDALLDELGADADRVVAFDYSVVDGGGDSTTSSRTVRARAAANELDALLRELSESHSNIYSIHHSKGAVAGMMVISDLDSGERAPIDGYRGAAMLDPPIARGPVGFLQRVARFLPWAPDNGGFDPIDCSLGGCSDQRAGLGKVSGVETIVIRNPDSPVTNFGDDPDDLRVYDLVDDGRPSAWKWWWNPIAFVGRSFEAHSSVLSSDAVARCIEDEVEEPGSCDWQGEQKPRAPIWGTANTQNLLD